MKVPSNLPHSPRESQCKSCLDWFWDTELVNGLCEPCSDEKEELDTLKADIKIVINTLSMLQKRHREITGQTEERARLVKESEDRKAAEEKAQADIAASEWQHKTYVNNQIVSAFCGIGWSESEANAVVKAVVKGKIPYMTVNY